jgi:hypothetical protein
MHAEKNHQTINPDCHTLSSSSHTHDSVSSLESTHRRNHQNKNFQNTHTRSNILSIAGHRPKSKKEKTTIGIDLKQGCQGRYLCVLQQAKTKTVQRKDEETNQKNKIIRKNRAEKRSLPRASNRQNALQVNAWPI